MSYDFHLIADEDPRITHFPRACAMFEDKFVLDTAGKDRGKGDGAEAPAHLVLSLAGEELALVTVPRMIQPRELNRIFGAGVATQLRGAAWVSEVVCPLDKDTAEAVRDFLMITVHETRGVVIDPQARQVLNVLDA